MRIQIEVADDLMIVRNKRGEGSVSWMFRFHGVWGRADEVHQGVGEDAMCDAFRNELCRVIDIKPRGEGLEGLNQACRDLGEMMNWDMGPKDRVMVVALID